ncbi:MAG: heavy-metal-associated domain-containing protein [Clostridiales bacterium]|jgi:copper chaperone CopZ|nr:heavy-metal-associated domain-containing protein [Clostridiales bacterium]
MPKESAYFKLDKISGKHQVKELKKELDTLNGIFSVSVNDRTDKVAVDYDTSGVGLELILKKIENLGYHIVSAEVDHRLDQLSKPWS